MIVREAWRERRWPSALPGKVLDLEVSVIQLTSNVSAGKMSSIILRSPYIIKLQADTALQADALVFRHMLKLGKIPFRRAVIAAEDSGLHRHVSSLSIRSQGPDCQSVKVRPCCRAFSGRVRQLTRLTSSRTLGAPLPFFSSPPC